MGEQLIWIFAFFSGVCLRAHSCQDTGPNWAELWPKKQVWAL